MSKLQVETKNSNKVAKGIQDSKIAKNESNDCVVRAISTAFDCDYDKAHNWVSRYFGRKNRKGTLNYHGVMVKKMMAFGKKITQLGDDIFENSEGKYQLKRPFTYYGNSFEKLEQRPYKAKVVAKYSNRGKEMAKVRRMMTVKTFLESHKKGVFLVEISRHVFTVKDGIVYGNPEDGERLRSRVKSVFQIG